MEPSRLGKPNKKDPQSMSQEADSHQTPKSGAASILDVQPPELGNEISVVCKPLSPWVPVRTA